jgi:S-adenosylmethionine decarboxylase proenzyme
LPSGQHLLVDCRNVARGVCLNDQLLLETLAEAAKAAGATVVSQVRYRFGSDSPPGCTAFVMLDESHCSAHTYADAGLIAFDFFTCGNTDPNQIWQSVCQRLGLTDSTTRELARFEPRNVNADSLGESQAASAVVGAGEAGK